MVADTYNAAADHYDSLPFWQYYGDRSVERARLQLGQTVLDVCSGTGASAIPAARAVGARGRVIGLDLAMALIEMARAKAAAESLAQVEFRQANFDQAYFRNSSFDAVLCVFGLFFFPDMRATLQKMWRLLPPAGRLVITTWGTDLFEPANTVFWDAVREVRPELYKNFNPWDQLTTPDLVRAVFAAAAIPGVEIEVEDRELPIASGAEWWNVVMGSGYRATISQLTENELTHVRAASLAASCAPVRIPAIYAVAVKP